jgi:signal transduction histidine kinase
MLRRLRWQLTALYLLAALVLIALVGGGAYSLLRYYFGLTTDLALQYRMALELRLAGATLPPELAQAERTWRTGHNAAPQPTAVPASHTDEEKSEKPAHSNPSTDETYDGDLAATFALPLSAEGVLLTAPASLPPGGPQLEGVRAALAAGHDWRTVRLAGGSAVRLLTYRVQGGTGPAVLQVGRTLDDQNRILGQFWLGLVGLGGLSALLLALASWWLAGRSLNPAQQAWERQQRFVANASHELRTPLTLIRASAEVAQRGLPETDDRRALLTDILQECDHTSSLVDDLLLLSRLDAGKLPLDRQPINLPELLADVQRQMGRVAEARGVQVEVAQADGVALGDPTRVRQVLLILLDNAVRHTPAGGAVRLGALRHGRQVAITVADTGTGIAPEHLPRLFDRFYHAGARSGSGLGLSIAKGLVEAHGGQIRVESRPQEGTRVTVTLPHP